MSDEKTPDVVPAPETPAAPESAPRPEGLAPGEKTMAELEAEINEAHLLFRHRSEDEMK